MKPPSAPPPLTAMAKRKEQLEDARAVLFEKWRCALEDAHGNVTKAANGFSPRPPRGGSTTIKHRIYALVDPRNGEIRYVGQSMRKYRLSGHIGEARSNRGRGNISAAEARYAWILELIDGGTRPILIRLEEVDNRQEALKAENWWIRFLSAKGCRLFNYIPNESRSRQITISLPPDLIDALTALANGDHIRRTEIIRGCLRDFVEAST